MASRLGMVAVALLWTALVAAQTPQQLATQALKQRPVSCSSVTSSADCHTRYASGCETEANPGYDAYLNFLKDTLPPTSSSAAEPIDLAKLQALEKGTPAKLSTGNHRTFSSTFVALNEGEIVQATGFLYYAQQTGAESCNCDRSGTVDSDYHIGLGFDPSLVSVAQTRPGETSPQFHTLQVNSMIVEITPYYRAKFEPNWTLDKLQALYGKQIMVVGQLTADNDHYGTDQDCGMKGADTSQCWRLSIWEIHPVTAFYVCNSDKTCSANDAAWVKLEDWKP